MSSRTYRALMTVITISILSKIIGFIRDIFHAQALGTTTANDSYFLAFVITNTFITIIIVAINSTFIPAITSKIFDDKKNKDDTLNTFLLFYFIIGIVLMLLMFSLSPMLVNFIAKGFDDQSILLTIKLVRLMSLSMPIVAILTILNGVLQYNEKYIIPTLIGVFPSLFIILSSILLDYPKNIYGISLSYLFGYSFLVVIALIYIFKAKLIKFKVLLDLRDKYLINSLILIIPILLATIFQQIDIIITRYFASTLGEGGVSALSYANRLTLVGVNLIAYAISMIMYPKFSKLYKNNKLKEFSNALLMSFEFSFYIFTPITIFIYLNSYEVVQLVFQRGAFDEISTKMTSQALMYLCLAMLPLTIREFMNKAFYSISDTISPVMLSALTIIINITLAYFLVSNFGLSGITLAYSIASSILAALLILTFWKKHFLIFNKKFISNIVRNAVVGIVLLIIVSNINIKGVNFQLNNTTELVIDLFILVVTYLMLSYIFKIDILISFISSLKSEKQKK